MCSVGGCVRENYKDYDKCILHCQKPEYFDDCWHDAVGEFKQAFAEYLAELMCNAFRQNTFRFDKDHEYTYDEVKDFFLNLKKGTDEDSSQLYSAGAPLKIFEALKSRAPTLVGVIFPGVQDRDEFENYLPMLEVFGGIEFMDCTFKHYFWPDLKDVGVLYFKCKFESNHGVKTHPPFPINSDNRSQDAQDYHAKEIDESKKLPIYRECIFFDDVDVTGRYEIRKKFVRNVFEDCEFKKSLEIDFCLFTKGMLFKNQHFANLDTIIIRNSLFETPFRLNQIRTDDLRLYGCEFKSKFEIKESKLKDVEVYDCNFFAVADFYQTKFTDSFLMEKSVFESFAAFEDTQFGVDKKPLNQPVIFKYVTFKEFSNFRSAKFFDGLDIEKSNFAQPPNFLGAKVELRNSPRETFRIIKHSFDDVGNYIEANKFFSKEMKKMRQSMPICDTRGLVFWLNDLISGFGQSWFRPLIMLLGLSVINGYYFYSPSEYVDAAGVDQVRQACTGNLPWWDAAACSIMPFNGLLNPGSEAISLGFGIIGSILVWQIVVAVKRLTRR